MASWPTRLTSGGPFLTFPKLTRSLISQFFAFDTRFIEVTGASARTTAAGVTRYDNGDKLYTRSMGHTDLKALTSSGKWTVTGATGKLRGIKGGGTYTCKMKSAEPGAGYTCDVEGEYTLPAGKK